MPDINSYLCSATYLANSSILASEKFSKKKYGALVNAVARFLCKIGNLSKIGLSNIGISNISAESHSFKWAIFTSSNFPLCIASIVLI